MFRFLHPRGFYDRSPLQFQRATWLQERLRNVYKEYLTYKQQNQARVASNHLLLTILNAITVPFDGDVIRYMDLVEQQSKRIAGTLRLTTSAVRGDFFKDVFYKGVNEVIVVGKSDFEPIDLWWDWRNVAPVTVTAHPVTQFTLFDPVVVNTPDLNTPDGYVQVNIDIPMLAVQYRMYKSTFPTGTMEQYVAQVVVPAMMRSHLDIVLFNKVCVLLGLMTATSIRSNLPFGQPNLEPQADQLAKEIVDILLNKSLEPAQILSTIPAFFDSTTALQALKHPAILLSSQSMWALHSQAIDKAKLVLEIYQRRGAYDRALAFLARIKRDNIQIVQEGHYRNGLKPDSQRYLMKRWEDVLSKIPMEAFEAIDLTQIV